MAVGVLNKDINLLPRRKLEEISRKKAQRHVLYYMILVLSILICFALFCMNYYAGMLSAKTSLETQITELNMTEARMQELEAVNAAIAARERYRENIDKSNTSMISLLDFLENEDANGVFLSGFSDGTAQGGEKQITITGSAVNKDVIADFQDKLNESGMFSSVFMPSLTQVERADSTSVFGEGATNATLVMFSIICVLR